MSERIEIRQDVHFGKPCVAGTRVPVLGVLELIAEGLGFDEILKNYYLHLEREDIQACIQYAKLDLMSLPPSEGEG